MNFLCLPSYVHEEPSSLRLLYDGIFIQHERLYRVDHRMKLCFWMKW